MSGVRVLRIAALVTALAVPGTTLPAVAPTVAATVDLQFESSVIDFGTVTVGLSGAAAPDRVIQLTNAGADLVTNLTIGIDGPTTPVFEQWQPAYPCADGSLEAGATCLIYVRFAPIAVGPAPAHTLVASGSAGGAPVEASSQLTGYGTVWKHRRVPGDVSTGGGTIARTLLESRVYLHSVVTSGRAIRYARTEDNGKTWQKSMRLNGSTQVGSDARVASAGSYVYVTWLRHGSAGAMVYVRRNRDHGKLSTWSSRIRLTPETAMADRPTIAAAGRNVYVAYTNVETGAVALRISRDRGVTWRRVQVGTVAESNSSTCPDAAGGAAVLTSDCGSLAGAALVAASGSNVVVAWHDGGRTYSRVSTDGGAHWGARTDHGARTTTAATAYGSRLALAGTAAGAGWVRVWRSGSWGAVRSIGSPSPEPGTWMETPAVALRGTSDLAVAYVQAWPLGSADALAWRTSADNGITWTASERIAGVGDGSPTWSDLHAPSVVWRSTGRAFVTSLSLPEESGGETSVRFDVQP